ncbi:hypothetical protein [Limisalsivibrio acetivorans]|uniref:hypothetical protein n=1 Tax=Limisalsivibrio acetivorans TaxID=1304888 RepID=UPI0003B4248E|nr:hypothetical protein [Limisalsivibrio acetivorans]
MIDFAKVETGPLSFAGWTVCISQGRGDVTDSGGERVAEFTITDDGNIRLTSGEAKYKDMAVVAFRSFLRRKGIYPGENTLLEQKTG